MMSSLIGVEAMYADAIAAAVSNELQNYGIDPSSVHLTGRAEAGARVLSVGIVINGDSFRPMLIETDNFKPSLGGQMDLLRAWLGAGHPSQIVSVHSVRYKAGERVPVPDAMEPVVAVRDSHNNRVWVVSERTANDPSAEPIPYLIFWDGSLVREQQRGLPD
jgi:hypothetical protein